MRSVRAQIGTVNRKKKMDTKRQRYINSCEDFHFAENNFQIYTAKSVIIGEKKEAHQIRAINYRTMYCFHGSNFVSNERFKNQRSTKRVISKLAREVAPLKHQIVVIGKETSWDIKGWKRVQPGYATALAVELKKVLKERLIYQDEFRTTVVCR